MKEEDEKMLEHWNDVTERLNEEEWIQEDVFVLAVRQYDGFMFGNEEDGGYAMLPRYDCKTLILSNLEFKEEDGERYIRSCNQLGVPFDNEFIERIKSMFEMLKKTGDDMLSEMVEEDHETSSIGDDLIYIG